MNPQDDPEARIRDLERPLSEQAHASELGTEPYHGGTGSFPPPLPPPPPPPWSQGQGYPPPYPPTYPMPQPMSQPMSSSGGRGGFVVLAFVVIGLLLAGGGYAIYLTFTSSTPGTPNNPGFSGGGGPVASPTKRPGSTKQLPTTAPTQAGPTAASPAGPEVVPAGQPVSISGIGANRTIACADNPVSISGVSNTVVITGHCVSVTVSGFENVVTVDSSDEIGVSGFDNRVTFHSGAPAITNSGGNNTVGQG